MGIFSEIQSQFINRDDNFFFFTLTFNTHSHQIPLPTGSTHATHGMARQIRELNQANTDCIREIALWMRPFQLEQPPDVAPHRAVQC